jgi:hypothetical protein
MSVNTEVFDIQPKPAKEALDLQEQRVNFFNSILEMASTAKIPKATKAKEEKEAKPKAEKKKPELTDEHKTKMLENLQKGREKRRAIVESKKQTSELKPEVKQEVKPEVKPEIKEVIKEVPIVDPEYEEWKKQKQAKAQPEPTAKPMAASVPIPIPQPPKLNVYSTYKKPIW